MSDWKYKQVGGVTVKTKNVLNYESIWENVYNQDINELVLNVSDCYNITNGFI